MPDMRAVQAFPIPGGLTPVQRRAFMAMRRALSPKTPLPATSAHEGAPGTTFYEEGWQGVQVNKTTVQRVALENY